MSSSCSHSHGHHGHHHHHGGAEPSAVSFNKEYFNKEAAEYDQKHAKTHEQLMEELRARLGFIGVEWVGDESTEDSKKRSVRLLDYACGTGFVSRALSPYTTECVGIDLSENMVARYNHQAESLGSSSKMRAYQGNLCDPQDENPETFKSADFFGFDLAVVGLGFHHFDDPNLAARRLAARLKPGGVLVILDFLPHAKPDASHPATSTVTHHGFSEEQIRGVFEQAGVGKDFALDELKTDIRFPKPDGSEMSRTVFIARGTKA